MFLILLTLLFVTEVVLVNSASDDPNSNYEVPVPEIIAFRNRRGFRVSIPDSPGLEEFRFYGNINEEIENLHSGRIVMITYEKTNGMWVLENNDVRLRRNDIISYWVYVRRYNLAYVKMPNNILIEGRYLHNKPTYKKYANSCQF